MNFLDGLDEIIAEQEEIQGKEVMKLIRDVGKALDVAWDDPQPINLEEK